MAVDEGQFTRLAEICTGIGLHIETLELTNGDTVHRVLCAGESAFAKALLEKDPVQ